MSKRAPKAETSPCRRAAQPSSPSSARRSEAPARRPPGAGTREDARLEGEGHEDGRPAGAKEGDAVGDAEAGDGDAGRRAARSPRRAISPKSARPASGRRRARERQGGERADDGGADGARRRERAPPRTAQDRRAGPGSDHRTLWTAGCDPPIRLRGMEVWARVARSVGRGEVAWVSAPSRGCSTGSPCFSCW